MSSENWVERYASLFILTNDFFEGHESEQMKKEKSVTIRDEVIDGTKISLAIQIDGEGNLIMDGYDIGDAPKEFWGDSDYEYSVTVKEHFKEDVLLHLIKDRFNTSTQFMEWLDAHKIPYKFFSWV